MADEGAHRALVVEDDEANRLVLTRFLTQEGFDVEAVTDGPSAIRAVTEHPPDVVILDLGLPGIDGMDVLATIRRDRGVRVLVLTGPDDEPAKLAGFEVGADDYVVKPFSLAEINARIRALIRRGAPIDRRERLEFDRLAIDRRAGVVTLDGTPIDLRPKEFGLLAFMASDPGRCFSREELLEHVWGSTEGWQQAATVTEHIHRLRSRLAVEGGHDWIQTVRGMGYRFVVG
jgi:two-component system, OmpR family, phosphate regulon response regulator PhoB